MCRRRSAQEVAPLPPRATSNRNAAAIANGGRKHDHAKRFAIGLRWRSQRPPSQRRGDAGPDQIWKRRTLFQLGVPSRQIKNRTLGEALQIRLLAFGRPRTTLAQESVFSLGIALGIAKEQNGKIER